MVSYPCLLPLPLLATHQVNQISNIVSTQMQSGYKRTRRKFESVPSIMTATWRLKPELAAFFEGWIESALLGGVAQFQMPVELPNGLKSCDVRFLKDPRESAKKMACVWEYSATIEIKDRKINNECEIVEFALAPNTLEQFVIGVENALSSYQE